MTFSLFSKRLNKMRGLTEKDATAEKTYPQDNTALTQLSTAVGRTHTPPFKDIYLKQQTPH